LMILTLAAIAIFSLTTRKRDDQGKDKWSGVRSEKDDHDRRSGT
jgi:hypothetical protein